MKINDLRDLYIGRELDGRVLTVEIDCSEWKSKYPQLTEYRIEVTSPEGIIYFAKTSMEDDMLYWPITKLDTAAEGKGAYQIVATGADGTQKTSTHPTLVVQSTMPGTAQETPPSPS